MLVIPYVVLQELDKLKMSTENVTSVQAMIAIGFICDHLKREPNKIYGQSAMDSGNKLIDIHSANDSIINCCLQLQQNFGIVRNVVLLTNDMNLSNRAICSHIEAFSKSEFDEIFLQSWMHFEIYYIFLLYDIYVIIHSFNSEIELEKYTISCFVFLHESWLLLHYFY